MDFMGLLTLRELLDLDLSKKEDWQIMFDFCREEGILIVTNDFAMRGSGKTFNLVEYARQKSLPIVVANDSNKKTLSQRYPDIKYFTLKEAASRPEMFLIEEGVSLLQLIQYNINFATGYLNIK